MCSDCLSRMIKKETSSSRDYVECPTCREKCFKRLAEIPKSLVMIQLMDAAKSSNIQSIPLNNNNSNQSSASTNYYPNFAAFHPLGTPHDIELKDPPSYSQVNSHNNTSPPNYQNQNQSQ